MSDQEVQPADEISTPKFAENEELISMQNMHICSMLEGLGLLYQNTIYMGMNEYKITPFGLTFVKAMDLKI